ncbi:activating signal cointegrator 1 complex subunit 2-like isoform X2 [Copidosoma floridanum]|uniref:activating signal cointegrator 1 complex subunit 2-like isoform X2 n=1 Tax=Copidosoma floridanum TaxID=29053 RepID=UPI000C6F708C|nr:activating signal cointegrator 1 complex subunit 2-like isoform X2 [Copidosoma floridanum]
MSSLSGKEFIIDYNNLYPVIDDFQVLAKLYPDLDPLKCEFIMKSVFVFFDEPMSFTNSQDFLRKCKRASTKDNLSESSNEITATRLPCNNTDPKTNLIPLIKEVKDIFSDLTEGFIEKCLENYNYSSESVINAVLENSLPTELISFYCMSPVIPPLSDEASAAIDVDIGRQRLNIYNNNEFDVTTQSSVKSSNIQQGQRKDKHKSLNELLNDKSYLVATKYVYNRYSIVSDDYDDEYDDTYDDINTIGLNTQDDISDINGRPFTTPNVFRKYKSNNSEKIEKIEFEDAVNIKENRSLFSHNPDLKKIKTKEQPCHNSKARMVDPQNELVIGNLIDQGQQKNFFDCGYKKNTKKSSRPNHNRRSASQWKRNQGVLPL